MRDDDATIRAKLGEALKHPEIPWWHKPLVCKLGLHTLYVVGSEGILFPLLTLACPKCGAQRKCELGT